MIADGPGIAASESRHPLRDLAQGLELEPFVIRAGATASAVRTLRSLNLRTRTGATIIAIERKGDRITNPDPDLEFQPGDRVFLLGSPDQVHAARRILGNNVC